MIETLDQAGVRPLKPFQALCIECGGELLASLDAIPNCKCGARQWGIAGCSHCRALVKSKPRRRAAKPPTRAEESA